MPLKIFLVEDNAVIRQSMTEMLDDLLGAEVVGWAESEKEAVLALASCADGWDVALIDLFLQQGSGLGVARSCMVRQAHQEVFIVTNYATPAMRERSRALGVDAVYDKSTELDDLLERLARRANA